MAYEPTNWKAGDVVTSAKLNKMEQGIVSNNIIESTREGNIMTLNKTWQEIWDNNYTSAMINNGSSKLYLPITEISKTADNSRYSVTIGGALGGAKNLTCDSPDGYPSYDRSSESTNK